MADNEVCLRWNTFKNNLMTSLESLWNEDEYVDVTLMCRGQQIRSHQFVLSASSPFFSEIFKVASAAKVTGVRYQIIRPEPSTGYNTPSSRDLESGFIVAQLKAKKPDLDWLQLQIHVVDNFFVPFEPKTKTRA